jgi:hypothetical protein
MSKTSKLVVTLTKWEVEGRVVDDGHGGSDWERLDATSHEYKYARRDYPRGPEGKAEFIADLVAAFASEYVSFSATNNDWAAQPDGPYTVDYRDGRELEVSMHFGDNTPRYVIRDVINKVG